MALGTLQGSNSGAMNYIAKQGCQTHCGNITVPYPFGIGKDTGCSLGSSFYVNCNTSFDPPKLFIKSGNIRIYNISDSELRIFTNVGYRCYDQNRSVYIYPGTDLAGLFTFSEKNKLTVIGCDDYALITGSNYSSGCFGLCSKSSDVDEGECSGKGCCKTSITKGLTYYDVTLNTFNQHRNVSDFNECGYAFLSEEGSFRFGGAKDLSATYIDFYNRVRSSVPVVLDWVIAPAVRNCSNQANECKGKSQCYDVDSGGYRCRCNQGYEGNPYLDQGCQDIDECKDPEKYPCHGICINTPGNYTCKCKKGYSGDAMIRGGCQRKPFQTLLFSLGELTDKSDVYSLEHCLLQTLTGTTTPQLWIEYKRGLPKRPSMKEVTMELETWRKSRKHPWGSEDNDTFRGSSSNTTEMHDMMLPSAR
ncbi:kinase RLK-Pelle-WAK family protein [Tanacetum coccineum]